MNTLVKKLQGTGVAMVTPFKKDGAIDFLALGRLTEFIIKNKCEYLVPLGTTGESVTLSAEEKIAILEFIKEKNNKRVPIVLGLGGNNTQEVINDFRKFNFKGVDAILSVSPAYNKPSQKGIFQHYRMIAGESPVPVSGKVFDETELEYMIESVMDCHWTEGRWNKLFEEKLAAFI